MPRTYIQDGQHKNIKNLTEYKLIQDKINCCYWSYLHFKQKDKNIKLEEDYYDSIRSSHKDFMEKHNLIIKNNKLIQNALP